MPFFYTGPAGYDAVILARAAEMRDLGIGHSHPIYVHISGSALLYELDEPAGMIGWPVTGGLEFEFPGIRRLFLENHVRYTFVRYGVPYAVSIECFDGGARFRRISCRDADKVAVRLIKALRLAGGTPAQPTDELEPSTIERPAAHSTVFTYHSPGDLLPGTGFKAQGRRRRLHRLFQDPLPDGRRAGLRQFAVLHELGGLRRHRSFRRRHARPGRGLSLPGQRPARSSPTNPRPRTIPIRGAIISASTASSIVGQCPAGLGHQGQDIRPSSCKQRVPGANRCEPYQHDVVAVRDGAVLRAPGQEALYLVVNAPNERIRFRYLHMQPKQFDADGMVSGRLVREGEVIGKVGNYFKRERATTYHLHFDVQVPTKHGWVFVNPYMTLVAAYERLIRGRGHEIKEEPRDEVAAPAAPQQQPVPPAAAPVEQTALPAAAPSAVAAKPTEMLCRIGPAPGNQTPRMAPQ